MLLIECVLGGSLTQLIYCYVDWPKQNEQTLVTEQSSVHEMKRDLELVCKRQESPIFMNNRW